MMKLAVTGGTGFIGATSATPSSMRATRSSSEEAAQVHCKPEARWKGLLPDQAAEYIQTRRHEGRATDAETEADLRVHNGTLRQP
jgi:hypothetical protein